MANLPLLYSSDFYIAITRSGVLIRLVRSNEKRDDYETRECYKVYYSKEMAMELCIIWVSVQTSSRTDMFTILDGEKVQRCRSNSFF